ncbi:MAG: hypothetical protein HQL18_03375, partial [Candidatus Omnitrophica bacterium]|nr:hypothetical protein [Candidatus Omnitrophota bacterium]
PEVEALEWVSLDEEFARYQKWVANGRKPIGDINAGDYREYIDYAGLGQFIFCDPDVMALLKGTLLLRGIKVFGQEALNAQVSGENRTAVSARDSVFVRLFKTAIKVSWIVSGIVMVASLAALAFHPSIVIAFAKVLAEAIVMFAMLLLVNHYLKGRPYLQILTMAVGIVSLSLLVHFGDVVSGYGEFVSGCGLRFCSAFASVWVSKALTEKTTTHSGKLEGAFRWALSRGLVSGYFTYFVYLKFISTQFDAAIFGVLAPYLKAGFDLTIGTFLITLPNQIAFGAALGEQRSLWKQIRQFASSVWELFPVNFLLVSGCSSGLDVVSESGVLSGCSCRINSDLDSFIRVQGSQNFLKGWGSSAPGPGLNENSSAREGG